MKQARLDAYIKHAAGNIEVRFTGAENTPLPSFWQGESISFADEAAFVDAIQAVETKLDLTDLILLKCCKAYKVDPTLKAAFVTKAIDQFPVVLDLAGSSTVISI